MPLGKASDPLLIKAEQAIQAKVPANLQSALNKLVQAGCMILYSPKMHDEVMKELSGPGTPAQIAGIGATKLLGAMAHQNQAIMSKGIAPALGAAAGILVCEILDLMEKLGKVKVTPDILADATQTLMYTMAKAAGINQQTLAKAQQMQQQPQPQPPASAGGVLSSAAGG